MGKCHNEKKKVGLKERENEVRNIFLLVFRVKHC